jgi:hypothetical protein
MQSYSYGILVSTGLNQQAEIEVSIAAVAVKMGTFGALPSLTGFRAAINVPGDL